MKNIVKGFLYINSTTFQQNSHAVTLNLHQYEIKLTTNIV